MSTSSPVLVEIVSIPVAPTCILVEEVIALTNRCCTFGCKPGLGVRLHLIGAMWNVGLHSNQKPFAKLMRRLMDALRKDLVSNIPKYPQQIPSKYLIGATWNVGLHSSQKSFAKLMRRLVDTLRKDLVSNIPDEEAKTTPICFGILPNCSMKGCRLSGKEFGYT